MTPPPRRSAPDFAHTDRARHDRETKARALAAAAEELGLTSDALVFPGSARRDVLHLAGVASASEETWSVVHFVMAEHAATQPQSPAPAPTQVERCTVPQCGQPGRLYLAGVRCDTHAPWAVNGGHEVHPPPGTTLADMRAARGIATGAYQPPATTLVDDRAVASGKRRSTTAVYQAARAQQASRRRSGRDHTPPREGG